MSYESYREDAVRERIERDADIMRGLGRVPMVAPATWRTSPGRPSRTPATRRSPVATSTRKARQDYGTTCGVCGWEDEYAKDWRKFVEEQNAWTYRAYWEDLLGAMFA